MEPIIDGEVRKQGMRFSRKKLIIMLCLGVILIAGGLGYIFRDQFMPKADTNLAQVCSPTDPTKCTTCSETFEKLNEFNKATPSKLDYQPTQAQLQESLRGAQLAKLTSDCEQASGALRPWCRDQMETQAKVMASTLIDGLKLKAYAWYDKQTKVRGSAQPTTPNVTTTPDPVSGMYTQKKVEKIFYLTPSSNPTVAYTTKITTEYNQTTYSAVASLKSCFEKTKSLQTSGNFNIGVKLKIKAGSATYLFDVYDGGKLYGAYSATF